MDADRGKGLEIKLRKMFELSEQSQIAKEQQQAKSNTSVVIRRRKGEQDKRISRKLNKR